MLDEVYKDLYSTNINEWRELLKNKQFANDVVMSRAKLADDFKVKHPDIAAKHRNLSSIEKSKYAKDAANYIKHYIEQEKSKADFATKSNVSDPKGIKSNQLRLDRLNKLEAKLAEETTPKEGVKYEDLTDLQKYTFGQEFGLNYFNTDDRKKLDETATKLQEQARIKREQAKYEVEHPWKNLALDILTPARQNARRRGEEPSNIDTGLDVASNVATFIPLVGPVAKLGLAAKVASKLKSPAAKIAAKLTPAASDVAANTAVTTAIDARNQKAEDEDFGTYTPQQFAKNLGTAAAGTALSGLATRKSIPEFARLKVDPYVPNASKWLESKLLNPAEAVRDEILRKNENITSSLAKASTGKFYPQEVKDVLKQAEIFDELTPDDTKLLKKWGISDTDIDTYMTQRANAAQVQLLKKPETQTARRVKEFEDIKDAQDALKDTKLGKNIDLEASMYAIPLRESGIKKVLDAERKRRT